MTVAEQLAAAQQAHARYRQLAAKRNRDAAAIRTALQEANAALLAADAADPTHADEAWSAYLAATKGKSPETMLAFYAWALASPEEKARMEPPAL